MATPVLVDGVPLLIDGVPALSDDPCLCCAGEEDCESCCPSAVVVSADGIVGNTGSCEECGGIVDPGYCGTGGEAVYDRVGECETSGGGDIKSAIFMFGEEASGGTWQCSNKSFTFTPFGIPVTPNSPVCACLDYTAVGSYPGDSICGHSISENRSQDGLVNYSCGEECEIVDTPAGPCTVTMGILS